MRQCLVKDSELQADEQDFSKRRLPTKRWGSRDMDRNAVQNLTQSMKVPLHGVEFYLDDYQEY